MLWSFQGALETGRLEIDEERVSLGARTRSLTFPVDAIVAQAVEREPGRRIRGLPALMLELVTGDQIRLASLGGAGSLQEIALLVSAPGAAPGLRSSFPNPATTPR